MMSVEKLVKRLTPEERILEQRHYEDYWMRELYEWMWWYYWKFLR